VTAEGMGKTKHNKRGEATAPHRTTATVTVAVVLRTASTQQQTRTHSVAGEWGDPASTTLWRRRRPRQVSPRRLLESTTTFERCLTSNGPVPEAWEQACWHADKMRGMRKNSALIARRTDSGVASWFSCAVSAPKPVGRCGLPEWECSHWAIRCRDIQIQNFGSLIGQSPPARSRVLCEGIRSSRFCRC